jgi:UDP-N-acetylglucosamine--N-acetylmuramyl-(pentapeptide) pyrophosphoryl-undecaprenol N-acetylglucosamine transferase
MQNKKFPRLLFVGGGSGGHLSIIKGLIDYMRLENYDLDKVMVVGGKLGMIHDTNKSTDERIIPEFGVKYRLIRGGKFHRAFKLQTFKLIWGVIPGIGDSFKILNEFKPDIVFATGGYVIVPMIIAARLKGIKIVLHEQTMTAGLANKFAAQFATKIFTTFDESNKFYPANKIVKTGNIVRKEVLINKTNVKQLNQIVDNSKRAGRKIIYITGGSQGAHKINEFILSNLNELLKTYTLIWQTGDNQFHKDFQKIVSYIETTDSELTSFLYPVRYVKEEIGFILHNCDYVICRPGANTLYELAALDKKAIMIPLWVTSKNDQQKNAEWFSCEHKGKIIEEKKLSLENLYSALNELDNISHVDMNLNVTGVEERILLELRKISH